MMAFQDLPIKRKVTVVTMLTSVTVLLLTATAFTVYDLVTYRRTMVRNLSTQAAILAGQSTGALAERNEPEGAVILGALEADPRIQAAALYDAQSNLFARFPASAAPAEFPPVPGLSGSRFEGEHLVFFEPVVAGNTRLGTLLLKSQVRPLYVRLRDYGGIALLVLGGAVVVALALSSALQRRISGPILALAETAKVVSERRDFSVRAPGASHDELGLLTNAFNQMLARIQESEGIRSFLAAIVESSDAAVIGKDLQGNVVSWNAGAEQIFGYTAEEMLGQPITRILWPDRPDEEARLLEEVKRGGIRHLDTVRRRKDGRPIEVALTVSPIKNTRGDIIGISSISRDVTERRRAEREVAESRARLSGIIGSAMDAVISVDAEQRVTLFNEAAEKMFRCTAAEALGQSLDRFIPARFREAHRQDVEEFGRTGSTSRAMAHLRPLSALRADGEEFPIEASISQVEIAGQKIYTVILRDITERLRAQEALERHASAMREQAQALEHEMTERKQAEETVRRMNLELERRVEERTSELTAANHELEAFTYSVAHDLRAPLRHIDAFTRIVHEEFGAGLPEEAQRYLTNIRTGSRHMSQLVDDLLNLARVGRQELRRQPTPLGSLVQEVIAELKRETSGRQVEWRIEPLPTIQCDPGLMKQVFVNLLSNAVKYTRPRPVAVITVGCLRMGGDSAIFVRDNGVGFNMKYIDKLFGVFQRLHRAEEFEGTGVGLATVERILRKHGGCVWAEAAPDKGALFYFTVPGLDQAVEAEEQRVASSGVQP